MTPFQGGLLLAVIGLAAVACAGDPAPPSAPRDDGDGSRGSLRAPATPPPRAETGFIEVPPFEYTPEDGVTRATARHRLFTTFRPARHGGPAPLLVVYNGGPGASSATLLASGSLSTRVDFTADAMQSPVLVENTRPWTDFASVMVVDAPDTGFSYRIVDDPATAVVDFDPDADASIVLRALLAFLGRHPDYVPERLGFVGESYGGVRTQLILRRLFEHASMQDAAGGPYQDATLGQDIENYFRRVWPGLDVTALPDEERGRHLAQVHVQGLVMGQEQLDCSEYSGASATGGVMPECPVLPPLEGCVDAEWVSYNHCDLTDEDGTALEALPHATVTSPPLFEQLLEISPSAIFGFSPAERTGARRSSIGAFALDTALVALLGPLQPLDGYYQTGSAFDERVGVRTYRGDAPETASALPLKEIFLSQVWHVPAFFTNAGLDRLLRQDVLPPLLDAMDGVIAALDEAPRPGVARPGWIELCSQGDVAECRQLRFVRYPEAGHMVTFRAHVELAEDLAAWFDELRQGDEQ